MGKEWRKKNSKWLERSKRQKFTLINVTSERDPTSGRNWQNSEEAEAKHETIFIHISIFIYILIYAPPREF